MPAPLKLGLERSKLLFPDSLAFLLGSAGGGHVGKKAGGGG